MEKNLWHKTKYINITLLEEVLQKFKFITHLQINMVKAHDFKFL
jgi:hypothetical protein